MAWDYGRYRLNKQYDVNPISNLSYVNDHLDKSENALHQSWFVRIVVDTQDVV